MAWPFSELFAHHPRVTQRFCGIEAGLPIAFAAALWSCGTVNALLIALARHDAPLDGNGELVAHCAAGHEVFPIALAQRCAGSDVPMPGQDGKVNALSIALARHDALGPGPGRTVDVLPSTHAPMKRRRGNSSEPGLGLGYI